MTKTSGVFGAWIGLIENRKGAYPLVSRPKRGSVCKAPPMVWAQYHPESESSSLATRRPVEGTMLRQRGKQSTL